MHFTTLASSVVLMSATGLAEYTLKQDFFQGGFFNSFTFDTASDPTHGTVQYLSQSDAQSAGLISTNGTNAYIGVDYTNVTPNGRPSVRIMSNTAYDTGIVIVDIDHMPGGICGTWPAFWMLGGPNWPDHGEIDIIEGVNSLDTNTMSLHTTQGCTIANNGAFTGTIDASDCWISDPNQSNNQGCGIVTDDTTTYGKGFNAIGGGVYATQIDDGGNAITIWFFPRGSIPTDITNNSPDPTSWGKPLAQFNGDCNIANHFSDMSILFDTTFCGDYAGNVWTSDKECAPKADTCADYVINTPADFQDAYWSVNALKVFSSGTGTGDAVAQATAQDNVGADDKATSS